MQGRFIFVCWHPGKKKKKKKKALNDKLGGCFSQPRCYNSALRVCSLSPRPLHPLPHLLCRWHACTFWAPLFFRRCYVMINLPLGTWRPLAPQRIWRTLCAILGCLDFLRLCLSPDIQNGHLYSRPTVEGDCGLWFLSSDSGLLEKMRTPSMTNGCTWKDI